MLRHLLGNIDGGAQAYVTGERHELFYSHAARVDILS